MRAASRSPPGIADDRRGVTSLEYAVLLAIVGAATLVAANMIAERAIGHAAELLAGL